MSNEYSDSFEAVTVGNLGSLDVSWDDIDFAYAETQLRQQMSAVLGSLAVSEDEEEPGEISEDTLEEAVMTLQLSALVAGYLLGRRDRQPESRQVVKVTIPMSMEQLTAALLDAVTKGSIEVSV